MNESKNPSQTPMLIEERILDDRAAKFGKQVVERDFRMPDGSVIPILCLANSGKDSNMIFALTERGTVFLVDQFRFGINDWVLELPGGCPKLGQTWEDASRTELLEEVGAEARDMEIIGTTMRLNPATENTCFNAILATGCEVVRAQNLDSTEVMNVVEVPVEKFREMLKKGEITDARTVVTGYLILDHLGLLG